MVNNYFTFTRLYMLFTALILWHHRRHILNKYIVIATNNKTYISYHLISVLINTIYNNTSSNSVRIKYSKNIKKNTL